MSAVLDDLDMRRHCTGELHRAPTRLVDDRDLRWLGERVARRRAGPWPVSGTIVDYELATARAVREAHRAYALEWRYGRRFPCPAFPPWPDERTEYVSARRREAIEIAELRQSLLHRLAGEEPQGRA